MRSSIPFLTIQTTPIGRVRNSRLGEVGGLAWSHLDFPDGASGQEPACQCRRCRRRGFSLWVGKIPWRRAWQPTPVFLAGESHGQRSPVGCSPRGHSESDTTAGPRHAGTPASGSGAFRNVKLCALNHHAAPLPWASLWLPR